MNAFKIIPSSLAALLLSSACSWAACPDCALLGTNISTSSSNSYSGSQIFSTVLADSTFIETAEAANAVRFENPGFPNGSALPPGSIGTALVNPGILPNLPTSNGNFFLAVPIALRPVPIPPNGLFGYPQSLPIIMASDSSGSDSFSVQLLSDGNVTDPLDVFVDLQNPNTHQEETFLFPSVVSPTPFQWQQLMVSVYTNLSPTVTIPANTFVVQVGVFPKGQVPTAATVYQRIGDPGIAFQIPFKATNIGPLHYIIGSNLTPSATVSPITGEYTYYPFGVDSTFLGNSTFSGSMGSLFFNAGVPIGIANMAPGGFGDILQNGTFILGNGTFNQIPNLGPGSGANVLYPGAPAPNIFLGGPAVPDVSSMFAYTLNSGYIPGLGNTEFSQPQVTPTSGPTVTIEDIQILDPTDPEGDPDTPYTTFLDPNP